MLFFLGWASTAQAVISASERAALLDLYAATNGSSWNNKINWNNRAGTECTWYGVTCDDGQSYVVGINLFDNNLVGTLSSLSGLTALQYFRAGHNRLTGSIPSLSGLTTLQTFDVGGAFLSGSIPSLSGLTALQFLYIGGNQLTGSIPSLSGLAALQGFFAEGNQLSGSIPSLSGLTALQTFVVVGNQLTGSIPSLSGLTALQEFYVFANQLTGSIPPLSGLTALRIFNAANNQLSGAVPAAPSSLLAGQSNLCGNGLVSSGNPAIDAAWVTAQYTGGAAVHMPAGVAEGDWLACQTGGGLPTGSADCVFDWAERVYPNLFAPPGAVSQTLTPYYYRYYAGTNAYLGTSSADSHLYYFGPASGNTFFDAGLLSDWRIAAACP